MDRTLDAILTEINNSIKSGVSFGSSITAYNLCYHQEIPDRGTVPLLNQGNGQGKFIEWDDREPLRCYHRITDKIARETDPDKGIGRRPARYATYPMRVVFLGTRKDLTTAGYEDNESFARDVADAFPNFLSGKETAEVADIEVNKPVVYADEFPDVELEKLSLDGIAFYIDYELKAKLCWSGGVSPYLAFSFTADDFLVENQGVVQPHPLWFQNAYGDSVNGEGLIVQTPGDNQGSISYGFFSPLVIADIPLNSQLEIQVDLVRQDGDGDLDVLFNWPRGTTHETVRVGQAAGNYTVTSRINDTGSPIDSNRSFGLTTNLLGATAEKVTITQIRFYNRFTL